MAESEHDIHPSLLKRKIIHFDMDCFYAAVEMRDDPRLVGKPVIIGGQPNTRGVVATCSYEARRFGIHSAMACSQAYRLCPSAIFIPPNFEKYRAVSDQIRQVFKQFTQQVEPLSLDEAYLDVTHHELYATRIACLVKQNIFEATSLTGSAGVAPNKLLAKIASDMNKPNGITVVQPHQVRGFMSVLPLRKINGIGPATEKKLLSYGLKLCQDVWAYNLFDLVEKFGANLGGFLFHRARGIDERPVRSQSKRKSLGAENTFERDILDLNRLGAEILRVAHRVVEALWKQSIQGKTITLKVKYADFKVVTRSKTLNGYTCELTKIMDVAQELLNKTEAGRRPVRLIGVSVSNFRSPDDQILTPLI